MTIHAPKQYEMSHVVESDLHVAQCTLHGDDKDEGGVMIVLPKGLSLKKQPAIEMMKQTFNNKLTLNVLLSGLAVQIVPAS